jgi:1,4-dihydroxy-2-naphthoate octaprenyltransferase
MDTLNDSTAESSLAAPLGGMGLFAPAQPVEMPQSLLARVGAALRPDLALALTAPAIYGAALGWWQTGRFSWLLFGFLVVGVFSSAIAHQVLSTVYDYRRSLAPGVPPTEDLPTTPFAWLAGGALPPGLMLSAGWLFLTLGAVSALWLALLAGWPLLFFSGLSVLLVLGAFLPPLQYAMRPWGIGEAGLALGFGVLPFLAGYYLLAGSSLVALPLASALPLVILIFLVVFTNNLGSWRRDWRMGKRTLAVQLGAPRAFDLAGALTWSAYLAILLVTVFSRLPIWSLIGLGTLPLALGAYADIRRNDVRPEDGYCLRDTAAKATVWTCVLLCVALWISRAG